jgi:hypothetical protein
MLPRRFSRLRYSGEGDACFDALRADVGNANPGAKRHTNMATAIRVSI